MKKLTDVHVDVLRAVAEGRVTQLLVSSPESAEPWRIDGAQAVSRAFDGLRWRGLVGSQLRHADRLAVLTRGGREVLDELDAAAVHDPADCGGCDDHADAQAQADRDDRNGDVR